MTVSWIDCSVDIQLDLSANVPLFVYLAMSNRPALCEQKQTRVHWHDRCYFCWCAGHRDFPISVNDRT